MWKHKTPKTSKVCLRVYSFEFIVTLRRDANDNNNKTTATSIEIPCECRRNTFFATLVDGPVCSEKPNGAERHANTYKYEFSKL